MASRPVPAPYLSAGAEYLEALNKLGLNPNFLGWGWDAKAEQWLLVLVTSIVDAGGPLALNDLLFRAYNANATPKEISPFVVRVFSPEIVPQELYFLGVKDLRATKVGEPVDMTRPPIENMQLTLLGIDLEMVNSYQFKPAPINLKYQERKRAWDRFRNNVERLAA